MQLESFFLTTAEIAVVLIGFVTVFLTFVMGGREVGMADRMHSRSLLIGSYPMLIVPLIPIAAMHYGASEQQALFAFHLAGAATMTLVGLTMGLFYLRVGAANWRAIGTVHNVTSWSAGTLSSAVFAAGALGYAPAGNAVVAVILVFLMSATALFSFAAQQMHLFDWKNP